jgi:peptidoglycan hydrolase-like protein with peptidoglycan-binding domain
MNNSIVISSGHGKYVRGAAGVLDEVNEARKVVDRVYDILDGSGIEVKKYHDDTSHSQSENLERIVAYHNNQKRDLDVSVHFNAYQTTSKPMGTECLYVTQADLAGKVSLAISEAGEFINRGPKKNKDLYFLNKTAEPSILIEVCFVDSSTDAGLYQARFEEICISIASSIVGRELGEIPARPEIPEVPISQPDHDVLDRPTCNKGDYGYNVMEIQNVLRINPDGDFGSQTEKEVKKFQQENDLTADGVVGPQTWAALDAELDLPPYPPPLPPVAQPDTLIRITDAAMKSPIYNYSWNDRGRAPAGYIKGMALAYGQAYVRYKIGDSVAREMAKANTHDDATDALSWYNQAFKALGMNNDTDGVDTLRHLYVLITGLGMRESSGEHCCGRDQSASNTDSNTCEAGLFQMSWNASNCCTDIVNIFDQYDLEKKYAEPVIEAPQGYLEIWSEGVSCSTSEWKSYGSGDGYIFQEMCKHIPTFAVETCAIGLRNLRQHWGPINRREAELRPNADLLFKEVEKIVDELLTGDLM